MSGFRYILAQIDVKRNEVGIPDNPLGQANLQSALQLVFGLAGAMAFIIIVLGGLKYVLSQGQPQETAKAKDTVLYAVIGLVVCIFAFSLVTFVIREVG